MKIDVNVPVLLPRSAGPEARLASYAASFEIPRVAAADAPVALSVILARRGQDTVGRQVYRYSDDRFLRRIRIGNRPVSDIVLRLCLQAFYRGIVDEGLKPARTALGQAVKEVVNLPQPGKASEELLSRLMSRLPPAEEAGDAANAVMSRLLVIEDELWLAVPEPLIGLNIGIGTANVLQSDDMDIYSRKFDRTSRYYGQSGYVLYQTDQFDRALRDGGAAVGQPSDLYSYIERIELPHPGLLADGQLDMEMERRLRCLSIGFRRQFSTRAGDLRANTPTDLLVAMNEIDTLLVTGRPMEEVEGPFRDFVELASSHAARTDARGNWLRHLACARTTLERWDSRPIGADLSVPGSEQDHRPAS